MIKIIVEIVLGLLGFILYMRIDSLLAARINYINMKAKKCESEALSLIKNDQVSSIAYENTNNILSVIDFLIDKEIAIILHKLLFLFSTWSCWSRWSNTIYLLITRNRFIMRSTI